MLWCIKVCLVFLWVCILRSRGFACELLSNVALHCTAARENLRSLLSWPYPCHCQVVHAQQLEENDVCGSFRFCLHSLSSVCVDASSSFASIFQRGVGSSSFVFSCNGARLFHDELRCERILWILLNLRGVSRFLRIDDSSQSTTSRLVFPSACGLAK